MTPSYKSYIAATSKISVPYNFAQAVKNTNWCAAEIQALEANNTWDLVP